MIQDILMIQFIVCFIVDISGFVEEIKALCQRIVLGKHVKYSGYRLKPFDCSLCMCFWLVLLYCLFTIGFSIESFFIASLAALTADIVSNAMMALKDLIIKVLSYIG